mmetsp:Transcript_20169/g.20271  ORF Transcript_20169/g.20271 Transcript_20169/m.20271 type:complete len:243 (+) Transcript_20169:91-819(+)
MFMRIFAVLIYIVCVADAANFNIIPKSPLSVMRDSICRPIFPVALSVATSTGAFNAYAASKEKFEYMPALEGLDYGKARTVYPDFTQSPSGLQYKVVKEGTGLQPAKGDRVAVDWEGYTIGYYGRPFQTRNKVKGGAFDSAETDYFRWVVGSGSAITALDEGVQLMKEGGVVQFIVPVELGYPKGDTDHEFVGPKPTTFSGQRALNFVLDNQNMIDKTLLINCKLTRVDKMSKKGFLPSNES